MPVVKDIPIAKQPPQSIRQSGPRDHRADRLKGFQGRPGTEDRNRTFQKEAPPLNKDGREGVPQIDRDRTRVPTDRDWGKKETGATGRKAVEPIEQPAKSGWDRQDHKERILEKETIKAEQPTEKRLERTWEKSDQSGRRNEGAWGHRTGQEDIKGNTPRQGQDKGEPAQKKIVPIPLPTKPAIKEGEKAASPKASGSAAAVKQDVKQRTEKKVKDIKDQPQQERIQEESQKSQADRIRERGSHKENRTKGEDPDDRQK